MMHSKVRNDGVEVFADPARGEELLERARADVVAAEAGLADDDLSRADLGRALQRWSEYLRFARRLDESVEAKERALAIWRELDRPKAAFLVRLQLALIARETSTVGDPFDELRAELNADSKLEPYRKILEDFSGRFG